MKYHLVIRLAYLCAALPKVDGTFSQGISSQLSGNITNLMRTTSVTTESVLVNDLHCDGAGEDSTISGEEGIGSVAVVAKLFNCNK